jgi:hypothetical protein
MTFKKGEIPKGAKPFSKENQPEKNGRPKKLPPLDILMGKLLGEDEESGICKMDSILNALYEKALKGDVKAAEILLDRGYGKAKQIIDIDTKITEIAITKRIIEKGDKRD